MAHASAPLLRRVFAAAAGVAITTLAATTAAPASAAEPVRVGFFYTPIDTPDHQWQLTAYVESEGEGDLPALTLRRCATADTPSVDCTPLDDVVRGDDELSHDIPDLRDTGAVYEATATGAERTVTARSAPFRGPVVPVRIGFPGSVDGVIYARPHVGASILPGRAVWLFGGIGEIGEGIQLQSCTDSAGTDCRVLGQWGGPGTIARPEPVVLGAAEQGRWLRTIDRIFGTPDPRVIPPPTPFTPLEQQPAWRLTGGMTTWATGPSGLVEPAPVTPPVDRPPVTRTPVRRAPARRAARPRVRVARRLRSGSPLRVATVRCGAACRVRVTLRAGRRRAVLTHAARRAGTVRINVGRPTLRRLAGRRDRLTARVVVRVDGRVAGRGAIAVAPRLLRR